MQCISCKSGLYLLYNTTNCYPATWYNDYYINQTDRVLYPCSLIRDTNCYECNPFKPNAQTGGICLSCLPGYEYNKNTKKCLKCQLSRHWSLVAGLDYTQRSGYRVYDNAPQSLTLHYLGIPLEAHFVFWPESRFRVYLGAGVKAEKSFLVTGGEPLKDPFLFSVNVQAGADVRLFPGIRLYFSPVLSGYLTHSAYANTWDNRPQFSLRAGLSFDL